jgi:transposase InsO family protein
LNQLWVADITYIAIATGFVYLAAILDAWSPRVVGYAIMPHKFHVGESVILRPATFAMCQAGFTK